MISPEGFSFLPFLFTFCIFFFWFFFAVPWRDVPHCRNPARSSLDVFPLIRSNGLLHALLSGVTFPFFFSFTNIVYKRMFLLMMISSEGDSFLPSFFLIHISFTFGGDKIAVYSTWPCLFIFFWLEHYWVTSRVTPGVTYLIIFYNVF